MLSAKFASPCLKTGPPRHPILERINNQPLTLISTPPGFLFTDSLANTLTEQNRPMLWLRLGPEECDPGTLLLSLITCAQQLIPGLGNQTLQRMRAYPGPIFGWPDLFESLAEELSGELSPASVIVLEHSHFLRLNQPVLGLLSRHLLSRFPNQPARILISHKGLPAADLPPETELIGVQDLRSSTQANSDFQKNLFGSTQDRIRQRAFDLAEGREVVLQSIAAAYDALGTDYVEQSILRSKNTGQLLGRFAEALLATVSPEVLQALSLTFQVDYGHPLLLKKALGSDDLPEGPWLQLLENHWVRTRCVWEEPLRTAMGRKAIPDRPAMLRTAQYLASQNAEDSAIRIYLRLEDFFNAAKVLAGISETMLNRGQWATLTKWLDQIPQDVQHNFPHLLYTRGELAAASGQTGLARRSFAASASIFSNHFDRENTCQSLLAESTLAAWENDLERAKTSARLASSLAQAGGLVQQEGWAAWQLGCLSIISGDIDAALVHFSQATEAIQLQTVAGLFEQVENLALQQRENLKQQEFHRQARQSLQQAEQTTIAALNNLILSPFENLPDLLHTYGWTKTPVILKLSTPDKLEAEQVTENSGILSGFLHTILLHLQNSKNHQHHPREEEWINPDTSLQSSPFSAKSSPWSIPEAPVIKPKSNCATSGEASSAVDPAGKFDQPEVSRQLALSLPALHDTEQEPDDPIVDEPGLRLAAYLLGEFRASVNDQPVLEWPSSRGLAVLKYLLAHLEREVPRDILMDVFWPDASPDSARNNLNVAVYKLRQAFSSVTDQPVIIFEHGAYHLNPDMQVWTDGREFERHALAGRRLEVDGQISAAVDEFELAANLYQGDFMADDPYEDWAVTTREHLRVLFLDTLDRLSRIHYSHGAYGACAALCQRILEYDDCREDATCRLMRCYSRQGQYNLALRQYQAVVEALRTELDVEPEPATIQLAEQIRHRENV